MTSVPEAVRSQRKLDSEKLQELVVRLQDQLNDTRHVSRKLEGQLNCLLLLVRKAWTGDYEASEQVAQVVGVPPPHWTNVDARDCANSQSPGESYRDEDSHWRSEAAEASQILYFRERLGHLNSLLTQHSSLMNGYGRKLSLRPPRPNSAAMQSKTVRLRRSNSASSLGRNAEFHGDYLRWRDVVGQPETRLRATEYEETGQDNSSSSALVSRIPDQETRTGYIFDASGVVMQSPNATDASAQRMGDDVRAKPKTSSIRHDSGRPMKYETTRPISQARLPSSRPSSGKPPTSASSRQGRSSRKSAQRRPPAIDQFDREESSMHDMERHFEATVLDLQRRLGIDESGLVL